MELGKISPQAAKPVGMGIGGPVLAGFIVIGLFFGALGSWAFLAPMNSAAIAPGTVIVDTNRKTIQHLEGGIIDNIMVRDGDVVEKGELLLSLENTQPEANMSLLMGRWLGALALSDRLGAERDGLEGISRSVVDVEPQYEETRGELYAAQEKIFAARKLSNSGQASILGQQEKQLNEEIIGLEQQIDAEDRQIALIAEEIKGVSELVDKGLAKKSRLLALQRSSAELEGSRSQNYARIARARQSIGETTLRITELQSAFQNEVVQQLNDAQVELLNLEERLRHARDVLKRTKIIAPYRGTIVGLKVHTAGGVISPGEPLMEIVPLEDQLVVETRINPADIDVVYPGLPAQVRFTALSQRSTVPVDGELTSVSADSFTDERTGESYFLGRVRIPLDTSDLLDGATLHPGMQAEVIILTGERTMIDYLVQPLLDSFNRAFRES